MDWKVEESGDMYVGVALSKSGDGIYLFEEFAEVARASWMVAAEAERELRLSMVSSMRISAGVVETSAADAGRRRCAGVKLACRSAALFLQAVVG
jgi:hypothetical protein